VAAVVEKHEARVGDVVEDRDRDLERHHPVVAPADQQDARPDAGEVRRRIVFESGARIGPGKARLLERIRDTGSISAAAREMGMSYKRWRHA